MKRIFSIFLIITAVITLTACSNDKFISKFSKEGLSPYELTKKEENLLESFGMYNNFQIISFNAPKEAITLDVKVYNLKNGTNWKKADGGAISIGKERIPVEKLSGTFTMLMKDNHSFDFNINCCGRASYKTKESSSDTKYQASTHQFLTSFQNIELNKEIPVALFAYSNGSSMSSYSLQDYFEPSKFEGMDLVQVITLTFSDKEL